MSLENMRDLRTECNNHFNDSSTNGIKNIKFSNCKRTADCPQNGIYGKISRAVNKESEEDSKIQIFEDDWCPITGTRYYKTNELKFV